MIKRAAALIFPCLWAFCSPYTKNRTKPKPNKCGHFTRSASSLTSNTQGAADPIQNARRRSSYIFRRIQSTKAEYFKAVTNSKYSIVQLAQNSAVKSPLFLHSILQFVLAFLVIICYTIIKIRKGKHGESR